MKAALSTVTEIPPPEWRAGPDRTGAELKRGMFFNTIALLASNFRGVFTFLIARLLGAASLGVFLVAWATTDILSKVGMFGLDNAIIAFIARAEAAGERARSRALFHLAVTLAVGQSTLVAALAIVVVRFAGAQWKMDRQMIDVLSVLLCASPGVALYRICTAVSRGMKVMKHDIWSRGLTESALTTIAFLGAVALGWKTFGPAIAAIIGTGASGLVALALAASLFRSAQPAVATALCSRAPVAPQRSEAATDTALPGRAPVALPVATALCSRAALTPQHGETATGISYRAEARRLLGYSASISGYDLLNAFIVRLDVIMLGAFVGRAPGVTLATVGIYGAVVEVASGLRKVSQTFTPIFAPVIARLTAEGDQPHAAATFARVAQWMLWVLLPILAVLILAGGLILSIYGPAFREGTRWLTIVALACAANTFVGLAETVIMVQRPGINLVNSIVACVVAVLGNLWLISHFGAIGAAFGILLPYLLLGVLRQRALRLVFGWRNPWNNLWPPALAAVIAFAPALAVRSSLAGVMSEVFSALVFLALFGLEWWWFHYRHEPILQGEPV